MRYTRNGRLAGLVSDMDKGPLLAFLMVASHSHKEILRCARLSAQESSALRKPRGMRSVFSCKRLLVIMKERERAKER